MSTINALHYIAKNRLEWREVPAPVLESEGDVLVQPVAIAACDLDPVIARGETPFEGPFVMGHEFVGRVTDLGEAVTGVNEGDLVLAAFQPSCGGCRPCGLGHTAGCHHVPATSMYGVGAVSGDWGGAFADLIRVPFADFNLVGVPAGVTPIVAASASDNIADAYRAIVPGFRKFPDASVLITGPGSISLYAVLWAKAEGASSITYAAPPGDSLYVAKKLGAEVIPVDSWPDRFDSHEIVVNCSANPRAWQAVVESAVPQGFATNCAILFGGDADVSFLKLYMKGIEIHTGRVNSAALMRSVLNDIAGSRINPNLIEPTLVELEEVGNHLLDFRGTKLIALRR